MADAVVKKLSAIVLPGLFLLGVYDYLTNFESNHCNMTYMYEIPQYIPIPMQPDVHKQFPNYQLYLYGEGRYAESLRNRNYNGIPVLFIPGNAGSYKQVRSLASVAYRMSVEYSFHFNYFSVDLNEEYSALFGSTLHAQTEFVHVSIKHILKLYKSSKKSSPTSVIVVGHSMGGVIARALFTLPDFDASSVNVIYTQASPHQPIAYFDMYLKSFYDKVNFHWAQYRESQLSHVNFISFGGGHRDVMVRSSLTSLTSSKPFVMNLECLTSAIPMVWLSTDHNGIVWCKQLVLAIKRSMFDLIDPQKRQLNMDPLNRASILHYHFIRKQLKLNYDVLTRLNSTSVINPKGVWIEQRKSSWSYVQSKVTALKYFAIPIRRDGNLVIIGRHVDFHDWVMVCKANTEVNGSNTCEKGNVISRVRFLPSPDGYVKSMNLRLAEWRTNTHAVIQVQPTAEKVDTFAEIYDPEDRHVNFDVPYMPYNLVFTSLKLEKTARNAVFYNITLIGFNALWQAYVVKVTPLCKKCKTDFTSVMRFYVPWSKEDIHSFINCTNGGHSVVKLQSPKPDVPHSDPQLHFYLDPNCQFRITVSAAFSDIMGQIVRHYAAQIFVLSGALIIEILSAQLSAYLNEGKCPSLLDSLSPYRIFLTLVAPTYLVLYIYKLDAEVHIIEFVSNLSNLNLESQNLQFSGTLLLLYFCALILVQFFSRVLLIPVTIISYGSSFILYKYLKMEPGKLKVRQRFPIMCVVVSAVLISFAKASNGSLLLLFAFSLYMFKVGQLKGQFNSASNRGRDISYISLAANIHFTLLVLWFLTWLTTIPCLMVWVRNMQFDFKLRLDHSFIPASVLIASLVFCWTEEASKTPRWIIIGVIWMLRLLSISMVFFVMDTFYLVPIYICIAFMLIAVLYTFRIAHKKIE